MQYFVLVSGSVAPKNNLQKRVDFLTKRWHRAVTNEPYGLQPDLYRVLQDAQQRFPKCKPMSLHASGNGFRQGMEQYTFWIGVENSATTSLSVTLYRIEPEPLPMVFGDGADCIGCGCSDEGLEKPATAPACSIMKKVRLSQRNGLCTPNARPLFLGGAEPVQPLRRTEGRSGRRTPLAE